MKIKQIKQSYNLNNEAIDSISFEISAFLKQMKIEKKNALGIRLSFEEILLRWKDELGEDSVVNFMIGSRFGKPNISLCVNGRECNPLDLKNEDFGDWSNDFLSNLGLSPNYTYKNNQNIVALTFSKPQRNPLLIYLASVLLAVAVGLLGMLIPSETRLGVVEQVLTPIYNAFLGMLTAVAIPMVFLGISGGIYAMGDASVFGKIGKRMILRFLGISFLITLVCGAVSCIFFDINFVRVGTDLSGFNTVFQMLLDFLPNGLFVPFVEGKALQVIVIAVVIGFALLVLGDKAKYVAKNIEQLSYVGIFADELLSKIAPLFVFIIIVQNSWTNSLKDFARAWKLILVYLVLVFVFLGIYVVSISLKNKVRPLILIKKLFPTFLIASTTASTSATFGEYASAISNSLGISSKMSSFGAVLGLAFFSPSTAINYVVVAFYVAQTNDIACSVSWVIVAVVISFILSIATPTIPGGAIPIYAVLFAQLGLPSSALAVIIAIDVLFDFVATATDKSFIQMELVSQARVNDCIDNEILRK